MEQIIQHFIDLELLSEHASRVDLRKYKGVYRYERVSSGDSSEQGAYFCAVSKSLIPSKIEVFPLMFIHDLYDSEEWSKENNLLADFSQAEWKLLLKSRWMPEYLTMKKEDNKVAHKFVSEIEFKSDWLPIVDRIATSALTSPIVATVRYGMIDAWNFSNYVVETTSEYIDFQYWTTA